MSALEIACPNCRSVYALDEMVRTNFELEWSEEFNKGYYSAEGYSNQEDQALFTKCNQCHNFFWKDEAIKLEKKETGSMETMLRQAKQEAISHPSGFREKRDAPQFIEGWYDEILRSNLPKDKELYVRKKAWWGYCNYNRGMGRMKYYPTLKSRCLSTRSAKGLYHLARLVKWRPATPRNFRHYQDAFHMSYQEALTYWLISTTDKTYISFIEDFNPRAIDSAPEPEFTGSPTLNDLIFYENEHARWEKANAPIQQDNLNRLIHLLDNQNAKYRIMKAEALRQVGNFGACIMLLESLSSPTAIAIKLEAKNENSQVLNFAFQKYEEV